MSKAGFLVFSPAVNKRYMHRCLQLGGLSYPAPNPRVGAVIVHNHEIIGEGFHHKSGEPHAEVNAINSVKDRALLRESTLYVNLEPCSHHGKTPPCADLIIEKRIPHVVIANIDPHSAVAGKGIEKLENAGVKVETGILQNRGEWLNRRFFTYHKKQRPYVILKWAQSEDGIMDPSRDEGEKGVKWLTTDAARRLVHLWRSREDAIMIGARTAKIDEPSLTVREVEGINPIRVIVDPSGNWQPAGALADGSVKTIHLTSSPADYYNNPPVKNLLLSPEIPTEGAIMKALYDEGIQSVLIEGGSFTLSKFIEAGIWDEARILTAPSHQGEGLKAPGIDGQVTKRFTIGDDHVKILVRS